MTARVRKSTLWIWLAVTLAVLMVAFVGAAVATDASSFCPRCHEMQPYYDAWSEGPHAEEADCINCHVNPGLAARFEHKFVALQEVWAHYFGNRTFPLDTPPNVPNRRCEQCHRTVTVDLKNFSHDLHASKGNCQDCHPRTGHNVTTEALKSVGAFNSKSSPPSLVATVAVVSAGKANIPGHVKVVCSNCHDMRATGCRACHKPPHKERGDCSQCHQPGAKFVFTHPSESVDCTLCHQIPQDHPAAASGKPCIQCHPIRGSFNFKHPAQGANCVQCHKIPRGHPAGTRGQCSDCHTRPGVTWAFSHRGNTGEHSWRSFPCTKCHPKNYSDAYCTCHNGKPPSGD